MAKAGRTLGCPESTDFLHSHDGKTPASPCALPHVLPDDISPRAGQSGGFNSPFVRLPPYLDLPLAPTVPVVSLTAPPSHRGRVNSPAQKLARVRVLPAARGGWASLLGASLRGSVSFW